MIHKTPRIIEGGKGRAAYVLHWIWNLLVFDAFIKSLISEVSDYTENYYGKLQVYNQIKCLVLKVQKNLFKIYLNKYDSVMKDRP